jgi:hypothetical protein
MTLIVPYLSIVAVAHTRGGMVLSYSYWQQRFRGDPSMVGQLILVDNLPFTIAGVTAPVALGESFDGGLRGDGHEYRGFDGEMRGVKESRARAGFGALGY